MVPRNSRQWRRDARTQRVFFFSINTGSPHQNSLSTSYSSTAASKRQTYNFRKVSPAAPGARSSGLVEGVGRRGQQRGVSGFEVAEVRKIAAIPDRRRKLRSVGPRLCEVPHPITKLQSPP